VSVARADEPVVETCRAAAHREAQRAHREEADRRPPPKRAVRRQPQVAMPLM
jgi:hypothetical protein